MTKSETLGNVVNMPRTMANNILYGALPSPYAGKVRAYFRYKKIPFEERNASANAIRKVIRPRTGKVMIPVVITPDDECIQDSSCIIDHFERTYTRYPVYPSSPKQNLAARLLELYGDEWLVCTAMHYRWDFSRSNLWFLINDVGKVATNDYSRILNPVVGLAPYFFISRGARKLMGLTAPINQGIEKSFHKLIKDLDDHFSQHPYLFGERPSIADYSIGGMFAGCLYRDPHPKRIIRRSSPNLVAWIDRVHEQKDARYGDFLPDDEIPDTLLPILRRMFREQVPVLQKTGHLVDQWVMKHPDAQSFPRQIGELEFSIEGNKGTRKALPYSYWMFQRCHHIYEHAHGTEKSELSQLLKSVGGLNAFDHMSSTDLAYRNYKLVVDTSAPFPRKKHG